MTRPMIVLVLSAAILGWLFFDTALLSLIVAYLSGLTGGVAIMQMWRDWKRTH